MQKGTHKETCIYCHKVFRTKDDRVKECNSCGLVWVLDLNTWLWSLENRTSDNKNKGD